MADVMEIGEILVQPCLRRLDTKASIVSLLHEENLQVRRKMVHQDMKEMDQTYNKVLFYSAS